MLNQDFIGGMDLSSDFGDSVTTGGKRFECQVNLDALRGRRIQFAHDSSNHVRNIITLKTHMQGKGGGVSSPRMDPGASAQEIW
jgi:hypothetical protein